ncbi:hypothetical protein GDO86_004738 [Hymenochirus boettgeri]|uniref:CEP63/Deup1 N-terminal domain-containing protein n=1 Tax=Hymenochirus boettgeri TaxID=247094 RepID=A0A8T2KAU9_9PIPI|nr:hypothetical protein GDO86_004738 [Hymenochirus boettgeri]
MQIDTQFQLRPGFHHQLIGNSTCENELEELMHQIDIMVNNKKVEWEKHVRILEQKLEAQNQELTKTRDVLQEKNSEIEILSKKLEGVDKTQCDMVHNYERQLQALKYQLCKLKKSYEKLRFYQQKQQQDENTEFTAGLGKRDCELQWLNQKLEEYKSRATEWEKQRALYQNHLKSLTEQRETLSEQCELYQKESLSFQEQLSSRTRLHKEAITDSQCEIQRLRRLLDTSQETIRNDGVIIENLESTVKEITLSRNSLKDENQLLLRELKKCQKQFQLLRFFQSANDLTLV